MENAGHVHVKSWTNYGQTVKVTKCATKDHYFRVRAANDFGVAEPSVPAMIRKKEGTVFRCSDAMSLICTDRGCLYAELESKKKKEVEEVKSKAKPRTIWDKPDIIDVTSNSLTLRWKPSSVPQYAVQVCSLIPANIGMHDMRI